MGKSDSLDFWAERCEKKNHKIFLLYLPHILYNDRDSKGSQSEYFSLFSQQPTLVISKEMRFGDFTVKN